MNNIVIILSVVAIVGFISLLFFFNLRNVRSLRRERLKYLLKLEAEVLASEQTGPMKVMRKTAKLNPGNQQLPTGLMIKNGQTSAKATRQKAESTGKGRLSRKLEPFFDHIDQPLSWICTYQKHDGERYDLRPCDGGGVIAVIEWHFNEWLSRQRAYAQVGEDIYTIKEKILNSVSVRRNDMKEPLAVFNRFSSEVKFFGERTYHWIISNPLEKPCAFIDQDGIEALVYTGSMANIRIKNSNLDIVPVLLLLLIYEYHKDLDGMPFPTAE